MNIDEVLFAGSPANAGILTGTVEMDVLGDMLTIVMTNTSGSVSPDGNGAFNLMTGVGFTMPQGFTIASGSASILAGTQIGWSGTTDVSTEWGFANAPINSGHFDGSPSVLSYNHVVGTVQSDVDTQFAAGSIGNPPHVGGPDFGLLSASVPTSAAGGQKSAQSPLTVILKLSQAVGAGGEMAFLDFINQNPVGIAFASPGDSNRNRMVPEPTTVAVWGLIAATVCVSNRQRRKFCI